MFGDGFGKDTIRDFSASNAEDIDLSGAIAITGFADVLNNHLETDSIAGFAMIVARCDSILLTGVTVSQFGAGQDHSAADLTF